MPWICSGDKGNGNVNKVTTSQIPGTSRPTTHQGNTNSLKIFYCSRYCLRCKARICPVWDREHMAVVS